MIIVYGTRLYGSIDACGGSRIATRFVHIWYLPIVPIGSVLVMDGDSGLEIPMSGRSVLAGFLRPWGVIASLGMLAMTGMAFAASDLDESLIFAGVTMFFFLGVLALTILSFALIGRLSLHEKAKRLVYSIVLGRPIDPAAMGKAVYDTRNRLHHELMRRIEVLGSHGYRGVTDPQSQWGQLAFDPHMADAQALRLALTLSRLESVHAPPQTRSFFHGVHEATWNKMLALRLADLDVAARA